MAKIVGTNAANTLSGSRVADCIRGFGGNDILFGLDGNDTIFGSDGDDIIRGGNDDDALFGGDGNDIILGDHDDDALFGGDGDDLFVEGAGGTPYNGGNETFSGGAGFDIVVYEVGYVTGGITFDLIAGTVVWGRWNEKLTGVEGAVGSYSDDTFLGGRFSSFFDGGEGADLVVWRGGVGSFFGGTNVRASVEPGDTLDLRRHDGTVVADLSQDIYLLGAAPGFAAGEFESLIGAARHRNVLTGTDGENSLTGGSARDIIDGLDGDNTLFGGGGDDRLYAADGHHSAYGGGGNDIIRIGGDTTFRQSFSGGETIDGGSGNDIIQVTEAAGSIYGGDGDDGIRLSFSEHDLFAGAGDDRIYGSPGGTITDGGAGYDVLIGNGGAGLINFERLIGDDDHTYFILSAQQSMVRVDLRGDNDRLDSCTDVLVYGGSGHDSFQLHADATVYGGDGDDSLGYPVAGDTGLVTFFGGDGRDTVRGREAGGVLYGGLGDDSLSGMPGNRDPVTIYGGADNDRISVGLDGLAWGGSGDDSIVGARGSRVLGGSGDDRISASGSVHGGDGNDRIGLGDFAFAAGGTGSDIFEIFVSSRNDFLRATIADFDVTEDFLTHKLASFAAQGIDSFDDFLYVRQVGADTVIRVQELSAFGGKGVVLTLLDLDMTTLTDDILR